MKELLCNDTVPVNKSIRIAQYYKASKSAARQWNISKSKQIKWKQMKLRGTASVCTQILLSLRKPRDWQRRIKIYESPDKHIYATFSTDQPIKHSAVQKDVITKSSIDRHILKTRPSKLFGIISVSAVAALGAAGAWKYRNEITATGKRAMQGRNRSWEPESPTALVNEIPSHPESPELQEHTGSDSVLDPNDDSDSESKESPNDDSDSESKESPNADSDSESKESPNDDSDSESKESPNDDSDSESKESPNDDSDSESKIPRFNDEVTYDKDYSDDEEYSESDQKYLEGPTIADSKKLAADAIQKNTKFYSRRRARNHELSKIKQLNKLAKERDERKRKQEQDKKDDEQAIQLSRIKEHVKLMTELEKKSENETDEYMKRLWGKQIELAKSNEKNNKLTDFEIKKLKLEIEQLKLSQKIKENEHKEQQQREIKKKEDAATKQQKQQKQQQEAATKKQKQQEETATKKQQKKEESATKKQQKKEKSAMKKQQKKEEYATKQQQKQLLQTSNDIEKLKARLEKQQKKADEGQKQQEN